MAAAKKWKAMDDTMDLVEDAEESKEEEEKKKKGTKKKLPGPADPKGTMVSEQQEASAGPEHVDVQDFVYFHGRHLGSFKDTLYGNDPIRTNVRIFVQKRAGAATRLIFGEDSIRLGELRIEWLPEDWVRFEPILVVQWTTSSKIL